MAKNKTYKALFVDEPTRNEVAARAKRVRKTIDEFIIYLLTLDKHE